MSHNILNHIKNIRLSIDKIDISIPVSFISVFLCHLENVSIKQRPYVEFNYDINPYVYNGNRIQIKISRKRKKIKINERFFVQLLQPDEQTLIFIKDLIQKKLPYYELKQFNPSIKEIEVAMDMTSYDEDDLNQIYEFFDRHANLKYSRSGSLNYEEDTRYQGKDGNVRKGGKGIRTYKKDLKTGSVVRVETQLNRIFLRRNNIQIEDLPHLLQKINILDYLELLDDISDRGIRNMAESIHKRTDQSDSANNRRKIKNLENWLRKKILIVHSSGKYRPVPKQMDQVRVILKKYGFAYRPKKYFQPMVEVMDFLAQAIENQRK
jgi:hypothetical protein